MGVTTSIFPILDGDANSGPIELSDTDLTNWVRYISALGVNARRDLTNAQALQGEQLFASANCVQCHTPTPSLTTSPYHPVAELRNQTIHPYTDLLLHDLGPGLADSLGEGVATGSEWRTAPLWSIGLTAGVSGGESLPPRWPSRPQPRRGHFVARWRSRIRERKLPQHVLIRPRRSHHVLKISDCDSGRRNPKSGFKQR